MDPYISTYRQYKLETAELIGLLISNDGFMGRELLTASTPSKRAKTDKTKSIPCRDLIGLARAVSHNEVPVAASKRIVRLLDSVMEARSWCGNHAKHQTSETSDSVANESHVHFVDVLRQMRVALEPLARPREGKQSELSSRSDRSQISRTANLFAHLPLEWSSEAFNDSSREHPSRSPQEPAAMACKLSMDAEERKEEEELAITHFLLDCGRIRDYLEGLWTDWKHDKVSLSTESLTMDVAIDAIKRIHLEFALDFPHLAEHEEMASPIDGEYLLRVFTAVEGQRASIASKFDALIDEAGAGVLNYLEAHAALKKLRDANSSGKFVDFAPSLAEFDFSDRCRLAKSESGRRALPMMELVVRVAADCIMLMHFGGLKKGEPPILACADQLTQGLYEMHKSHKTASWLVVASQILIDINCLWDDSASNVFRDLARVSKQIMGRARVYLEFISQDIRQSPPNFVHTRDSITNMCIKFSQQWIEEDPRRKHEESTIQAGEQGSTRCHRVLHAQTPSIAVRENAFSSRMVHVLSEHPRS